MKTFEELTKANINIWVGLESSIPPSYLEQLAGAFTLPETGKHYTQLKEFCNRLANVSLKGKADIYTHSLEFIKYLVDGILAIEDESKRPTFEVHRFVVFDNNLQIVTMDFETVNTMLKYNLWEIR